MDIDKIEETIQYNSQKNTIDAKDNSKKGSPSGLSNQSANKAPTKTWSFYFSQAMLTGSYKNNTKLYPSIQDNLLIRMNYSTPNLPAYILSLPQ